MMLVLSIVLAVALGYAVTVGLSMVVTFRITAVSPKFVMRDHRIRQRYKLVQALQWLGCCVAGGYVAAAVTGAAYPWLSGTLLSVILIVVLWANTWEMKQRGLNSQLG